MDCYWQIGASDESLWGHNGVETVAPGERLACKPEGHSLESCTAHQNPAVRPGDIGTLCVRPLKLEQLSVLSLNLGVTIGLQKMTRKIEARPSRFHP
jgi:hypothetical protein